MPLTIINQWPYVITGGNLVFKYINVKWLTICCNCWFSNQIPQSYWISTLAILFANTCSSLAAHAIKKYVWIKLIWQEDKSQITETHKQEIQDSGEQTQAWVKRTQRASWNSPGHFNKQEDWIASSRIVFSWGLKRRKVEKK